jgi:uncharacterized protein (DUF736 family)
MSDDFKQLKDTGRLMASNSKRTEKSPDYWGEIAIDIKNLTKTETGDGFVVFKINGWKKKSKSGNTYLSLAVDRWLPKIKNLRSTTTMRILIRNIPF